MTAAAMMDHSWRGDEIVELSDFGLVLGLDAEVAIVPHVAVVPMVRCSLMGDPGPAVTYGIGAQWRF